MFISSHADNKVVPVSILIHILNAIGKGNAYAPQVFKEWVRARSQP